MTDEVIKSSHDADVSNKEVDSELSEEEQADQNTQKALESEKQGEASDDVMVEDEAQQQKEKNDQPVVDQPSATTTPPPQDQNELSSEQQQEITPTATVKDMSSPGREKDNDPKEVSTEAEAIIKTKKEESSMDENPTNDEDEQKRMTDSIVDMALQKQCGLSTEGDVDESTSLSAENDVEQSNNSNEESSTTTANNTTKDPTTMEKQASTTLEEKEEAQQNESSEKEPSNDSTNDFVQQQNQCEPLVMEDATLMNMQSSEEQEEASPAAATELPAHDKQWPLSDRKELTPSEAEDENDEQQEKQILSSGIPAQDELVELPSGEEALASSGVDKNDEVTMEDETSAPTIENVVALGEPPVLTEAPASTEAPAPAIIDTDSLPSIETLTLKGELGPDQVSPIFRKHGVVALRDKMTELDECNSQAKQALAALVEEQLEPRGLELDGVESFELWDARRETGRRLENQFRILDDGDSPIARLSRRLQHDLPLLLFGRDDDDFRLERAGVLHCFPRKKEDPLPGNEIWRRDGSSLFRDNHHDAYSFNVLIPLSDVPGSSGILEFIPGSHVEYLYDKVAPEVAQLAEQAPSAQHDMVLKASFPAGTIVILDNRVFHRGITNSSDEMVQQIYFTFTKKWFHEQKPSYFMMNKSSTEALAVHSQLLLMSRLYQLVTDASSTHLVSVSDSYGHKFFTDRFDLLLLEGLLSDVDEMKAAATANIAAVLHFSTLTDGDKETMTRQFVYSFSERSYERKARVLQKTRRKRQKLGEKLNDDALSVTIDPDSSDAVALCDLTSTIMMEETTLISKLGFTANEMGISCLLAMLKCHAARNSLGCIGVSSSRLDEVFALWWYARRGRFSFLPGHATSADDRASRRVIVVFIDLNAGKAVAEWTSSIRDACGSCDVDVLLVVDPVFSCFCQSPQGDWNGVDYFNSEIEARVSGYSSVMFLGDSFGASAALRFSTIADRVLAFAPHVDISSSSELKRSDFPGTTKVDFQDSLLRAVRTTEAKVSVHYSSPCKGQREDVELLSIEQEIELIAHDSVESDLCLNLEASGELMPILKAAIKDFASPPAPAQ